MIAGPLRVECEPAQSFRVSVGEARALGGSPPLEFWRVVKIKTLQERPVIKGNRVRQRSACQRSLEFCDVTRHDPEVEGDRIGSAEDRFAERPTQRVEQLLERVPRVCGSTLGPQVGEKLVATQSSFARSSQQGKQREPSALMREGRRCATAQRKLAESLQPICRHKFGSTPREV